MKQEVLTRDEMVARINARLDDKQHWMFLVGGARAVEWMQQLATDWDGTGKGWEIAMWDRPKCGIVFVEKARLPAGALIARLPQTFTDERLSAKDCFALLPDEAYARRAVEALIDAGVETDEL